MESVRRRVTGGTDFSLGRGVLEKKEKMAFLIAMVKASCDVSVRRLFDERGRSNLEHHAVEFQGCDVLRDEVHGSAFERVLAASRLVVGR